MAAAIPSTAMMGGACSRDTTALMHNIDSLLRSISSLPQLTSHLGLGRYKLTNNADTRKKMLAKKVNAKSALNLLHVPLSVMLPQCQIDPQFMGPMKFASRPNATINRAKRMKSMGQWMKDDAKGKRKRRAKRMPIAATTSV